MIRTATTANKQKEASVRVRGAFPAGKTVGLYDRRSDVFNPGQVGSPAKAAKADKNGDVHFKGLNEGDRFWAAYEDGSQWRHRAVTAKVAPDPKPASKGLESLAPGGADPVHNVTVGARNSKSGPEPLPTFGHKSVGRTEDREPEPQPAPPQEEFTGVPQRSDTITGEAHPKPPDEFSPAVPQSEMAKGQKQRSATEFGEATPIPAGEVDKAPSVPQDEVKGKQRSDTPEGEATPKPQKATKTRARKARARKVQVNPSASRVSAKTPASSTSDERQKPAKQTSARSSRSKSSSKSKSRSTSKSTNRK